MNTTTYQPRLILHREPALLLWFESAVSSFIYLRSKSIFFVSVELDLRFHYNSIVSRSAYCIYIKEDKLVLKITWAIDCWWTWIGFNLLRKTVIQLFFNLITCIFCGWLFWFGFDLNMLQNINRFSSETHGQICVDIEYTNDYVVQYNTMLHTAWQHKCRTHWGISLQLVNFPN